MFYHRYPNARLGLVTVPFSTINAERAHEGVARQLRDAILNGTYKPGDRLPGERELVDLFGVSRSAVRQALLLLQQQGLLLVRQGAGGGVFVNGRQVGPVLRAFENLFALQEPSIEHFVHAKALLEPVISATAAEAATPEDLAALRENLELSEQALSEGREVNELALKFHLLVATATHNEILTLILEAFVRIAARLSNNIEDWHHLLAEHHAIYHALESGNAEDVVRLTRKHLQGIR
ncbi:MAG: FadR family transcriptional regulator [Actinobacteria bacterium]|nr:FadR family transcriptional regulator [Actinomycetota bacterium]